MHKWNIELAAYMASSMAELCFSSMAEAKAAISDFKGMQSCFIEELDEMREWGAEELPSGLSHAAIKGGLLSACQLQAAHKLALAISKPLILQAIEANGIDDGPAMPPEGAARQAAIAKAIAKAKL